MSNSYIIFAIIIATLATFLTRALPFLVFKKRKPSAWVFFVEKNMPLMIMVILIFYSIKDVDFSHFPYGGAEISSLILAAILHISLKNVLLSIFVSTAFYMFLVN